MKPCLAFLASVLCAGTCVLGYTAPNNVWYVNPNDQQQPQRPPPLPAYHNARSQYWMNNVHYRQTNAPIHLEKARTITTGMPPTTTTQMSTSTTSDYNSAASGSDFALRILEILGLRKPSGQRSTLTGTGGGGSGNGNANPGGVSPTQRDGDSITQSVCPFDATPLIEQQRYRDCNPRNMLDCPTGYLCDRSFLLGRHVCCQDFSATTQSGTPPPSTTNTPPPPPPSTTTTTTTSTTTRTPVTTTTTTQTPEPARPEASTWDPLMPEFPGSTGSSPNVSVSLLSVGKLQLVFEGQYAASGTISLVRDGMTNILVDLGSPDDTEKLLDALARERVGLDDVDLVVITHGHPDHFANFNFFRNKPLLFGQVEMARDRMSRTLLSPRPYRRLTQNTEIWKTPGHTRQDISLVVRNVAGYGTIGIVGDLIFNEQSFLTGDTSAHPMGHWDADSQRQNANLMTCICDWIVPGHGTVFQVTQAHRIKASCSRLNMQALKFNKQ